MSERVPLLAAQADNHPIEAGNVNPPQMDVSLKGTYSSAEISHPIDRVVSGQVPSRQVSNPAPKTDEQPAVKESTNSSEKKEEQPTQNRPVATEGFLARCGGCMGTIMFPYGFNRVICSACNSVNYLTPDSIPVVRKKALMTCPECNSSILYTIGCTHFRCICGTVLEIPIPDYYIPHFVTSK